jgi:hypothetical protein
MTKLQPFRNSVAISLFYNEGPRDDRLIDTITLSQIANFIIIRQQGNFKSEFAHPALLHIILDNC